MTHRHLFVLALLAACGSKTKGTEPPIDPPIDPNGETSPDAGATAVEPTPAPDAAVEVAGPDPEVVKAELLASEQEAYAAAAPVFDGACARCHTATGKKKSTKKLDHFDMTSYPFGGHHTATITTTLRHVLGLDGAKAAMPADKPGSVGGDGLALIAAWADAYDAAEAGGAHEGQPGYTPAQ